MSIEEEYTISAALRALTASEVPIWKTTLSLSASHVLKTTFSLPFSTNSVVPEATVENTTTSEHREAGKL